MTLVRVAFVCAFLTLVVGAAAARSAVAPYFSSVGSGQSAPEVATKSTAVRPAGAPRVRAATASATPTARVIVRVVTATPTSHLGTTRLIVPTPRATSPPRSTRPKPTMTPAPWPSPSPTPGTVELARYWVDSRHARSGQIVAIGYVIDNSTGRVERISLGASLKARRALGWGAAINDPAHDVVAVIPPGVSTHLRYFALPKRLHPGPYDVAWGLREARSGQRVGLAFAPAVLTVTR